MRTPEVETVMSTISAWTSSVPVTLLRLGALACHFTTAPDLPADLVEDFLSQLNRCNNPGVKKVRPRLRSGLPPQVS